MSALLRITFFLVILALAVSVNRLEASACSGDIEWVDQFVGDLLRHQRRFIKEMQVEGDVGDSASGSDFSGRQLVPRGSTSTVSLLKSPRAWHVAWTKINALKHSLKHGLDSRDHPQGDGSSPIAAPPAPLPTSGTGSTGGQNGSTQVDPVHLTRGTTPIHSSYDGQIIENLDLYVASGDAITVTNDNVIIRNCVIHHQEGSGIFLSGASNVTIENCEVINSSPPTGINPETSDGIININGYNSPNLTVNHVTLRDGSNGIYLDSSPGAQISYVECYNVHGPFPRGEAVQFNHSGNSSLTDFYAYNDPANSYPEDIVSVYFSPNVTISRGLIVGNNSVSGNAITFEGDSGGGKVDHVDAVGQRNAAFASWGNTGSVTFDYTRAFDSTNGDQGRGLPVSGGVIWAVNSPVSILHSTYTHAQVAAVVWDPNKVTTLDVHEAPTAVPMDDPVTNHFEWK